MKRGNSGGDVPAVKKGKSSKFAFLFPLTKDQARKNRAIRRVQRHLRRAGYVAVRPSPAVWIITADANRGEYFASTFSDQYLMKAWAPCDCSTRSSWYCTRRPECTKGGVK